MGKRLPAIRLQAHDGSGEDLAEIGRTAAILYFFPKMGPPHVADPTGWSDIPGVYGCTQQTCGFRDRFGDFQDLGYRIAGISAQASSEHKEAAGRLHVMFPLLADPELLVRDAVGLPTFTMVGETYYKRLTMVVLKDEIVKVFYPVFPPHRSAERVLQWIHSTSLDLTR